MPAALERKLKAKVADKKMSKDRKDAYVYGTMRKTGWKPSREKKMNSAQKLVRLEQIDQDLESIIRFDYGDDDKDKKSILPAAAYGATAAGAGAAGLYGIGKMASVGAGGQGLSARGAVRDLGYNVGHLAGGGAGNLGRNVGQGAKVVGGAIKNIAGKAWNAAKGLFMESKDTPIELAELPAVGSSLERLRNIVKKAPPAGTVRIKLPLRGEGGPPKFSKADQTWSDLLTRQSQKEYPYSSGGRQTQPLYGKYQSPMFMSRDKAIEFASVPSTWVGGALRTPGTFESSVARQYGKKALFKPQFDMGPPSKNWLQRLTNRRAEMRQGNVGFSEPIQFGAEILGPWQGKTGHTCKIDQLEFPAAPSPLQLMQFPLPVLMRYLNQRNLQQQVFSWKAERLVQLSAKLDEINA